MGSADSYLNIKRRVNSAQTMSSNSSKAIALQHDVLLKKPALFSAGLSPNALTLCRRFNRRFSCVV